MLENALEESVSLSAAFVSYNQLTFLQGFAVIVGLLCLLYQIPLASRARINPLCADRRVAPVMDLCAPAENLTAREERRPYSSLLPRTPPTSYSAAA